MNKGFTTMELLVAMSLFVILISIVSGVFVSSLRTQRATVALIAANSNASLALEQMSREMRTGRDFSQSGQEITFTNAKGELVTYRWDSDSAAIERGINDNFKKITADNVQIRNLVFRIFTGSPEDAYPPRITIILQGGAANIPFSENTVNLETTISARTIK